MIHESDIRTSRHFDEQERSNLLRPGTVIELRPARQGLISISEILLGTLSRDREGSTAWKIRLYSTKKDIPKVGRYRLYPLSSLLTFARHFEALMKLRPGRYPDLVPRVPSDDNEEHHNMNEPKEYKQTNSKKTKTLMDCLVKPKNVSSRMRLKIL